MPRTNEAQVKEVLRLGSQGGDYDDANEPTLDPYIDTATLIVDRVATCAAAKGKTLTAGELERIECWLSAHYYACSDQTYAGKGTSGANASFHGQTGMGIESTRYGQAAMNIDYSGCLGAILKRQVAGGMWLGRPPSAQTAYADRD